MATRPGRDSDQFIVRLPDGMRDQIKVHAEQNGRSMNAEIVSRLVEYEHLQKTLSRLEASLKHQKLVSQMAKEQWEHAKALYEREKQRSRDAIPRDQTLYVALDADGHVLSWPEITTHLGEIGRLANLQIHSITARIFDGKLASSDTREEEWWNLVQHYRNLRKKRAKTKL